MDGIPLHRSLLMGTVVVFNSLPFFLFFVNDTKHLNTRGVHYMYEVIEMKEKKQNQKGGGLHDANREDFEGNDIFKLGYYPKGSSYAKDEGRSHIYYRKDENSAYWISIDCETWFKYTIENCSERTFKNLFWKEFDIRYAVEPNDLKEKYGRTQGGQ